MFESLLGDWRIATGVKASLLLVADNLEQLCRRWSEVCGIWIHMSLRGYLHGEGGTRGKITVKGVACKTHAQLLFVAPYHCIILTK